MPDGHSVFLAELSSLEENLRGVVEAVGLTPAERAHLASIIEANVTDHGDEFDAFEVLGVRRPDPRLN